MTSCQQGLCSPNVDGKRLSAVNLLELNLKAIDNIFMLRSSSIVEILWLGTDKGHGHQIWATEIPRDYYTIEIVKPYDSIVHYLTKIHCKIKYFKGSCQFESNFE